MDEKLIRQQARSLYQTAEQLKMLRLAQQGKLAEYLITRQLRKVQNKVNHQVRKAMGFK
jgi:hypothetical protein